MRTCLGWTLALLFALAPILTIREVRAAPVDMTLTLPLYRADSSCAATPDTVKNLSTLILYSSSTAALTDSTVVLTANVGGLYGKAYPFTVQQGPGTRWYWCVTRDSSNVRSCDKSNAFAKTVLAGPPWRITDLRAR